MKIFKRLFNLTLVAVLAIALIVTLIPFSASQAGAGEKAGAGPEPGMMIGSGWLRNNANTDNADIIWYGDRAWYVIGYDGSGNKAARKGVATVLQKEILENFQFTSDVYIQDRGYEYARSDLINRNEEYMNKDSSNCILNSIERVAVSGRTLKGGGAVKDDDNGTYDPNLMCGDDVENAHFWPLSMAEAQELPDVIRITGTDWSTMWWLRTASWLVYNVSQDPDSQLSLDPATDPEPDPLTWEGAMSYIDVVYGDGTCPDAGAASSWAHGVRPAFDIDTSMVVLTSAADGKLSNGVGHDALMAVPVNTTGEYKLTLRDSSRAGFSAQSDGLFTDGLKINYSGAVTGKYDFLSVIMTDSNDQVLYYGRVKALSSKSNAQGEVKVDIDDIYKDGYKVYVFNEHYSGDKKTDWSSDLVEVSVPKSKTYVVYVMANPAEGGNPVADSPLCSPGGYSIIEPRPNDGYEFVEWKVLAGGATIKYEGGSYNLQVGNDNAVVQAIYQKEGEGLENGLTVTLPKYSYTYTGKTIKPAVTVKDDGTVLDPSEYSVSYDKGRKDVGTYNVSVVLNNEDADTLQKSFSIVPKGAKLKSVKGKSKAVKVKWKKQSKKMSKSRITGYEILIATDSKFKENAQTVKVKGYKKTAKTIKGLKAKKKYYVKVRTYKTVGGTDLCSGWSKVKSVKTK